VISNLIEAVRIRLGIAAPTHWEIGEDKAQKHGSPPRWVWIPRRDRFGPAERIGGANRVLLTRICGVELQIWGANLADTETRLHDTITALHLEGATSVQLEQADWEPQSVQERGVLVVLQLSIKVPVLRPAAETVNVEAVAPDNTGTVTGDGKLDWGEST
jgi:hypothetical protein